MHFFAHITIYIAESKQEMQTEYDENILLVYRGIEAYEYVSMDLMSDHSMSHTTN